MKLRLGRGGRLRGAIEGLERDDVMVLRVCREHYILFLVPRHNEDVFEIA